VAADAVSDPDAGTVALRFVDALNGARAAAPAMMPAPLAQRVEAMHRAFPDLEATIEHLESAGDLACVHLSARGTHLAVYLGCPPTGRSWAATCTAILRVDRGSIADFWITWDDLAILEQIGAIERVAGVSA
jgi:hypothetical protein